MRAFLSTSAVLVSTLVMTAPAQADYILKVQDFTASPGSTGTFEVTLTNTNTSDATLSYYQIQLTTDLAGLTFTDVERSPFDYVFPGAVGSISSDFPGPPLTKFTALDLSVKTSGSDALNLGETYGVLLVHYAVDPSALTGTGHVSFVSPGVRDSDLTQLADGSFNLIDFNAVDGTVQITSNSVVPEPASIVLLLCAIFATLGWRFAAGMAGSLTNDVRRLTQH